MGATDGTVPRSKRRRGRCDVCFEARGHLKNCPKGRPQPELGGCGSCVLGLVIDQRLGEDAIGACRTCTPAGRGFATRDGTIVDQGFAIEFVMYALRSLEAVRDILHPPGDDSADWGADTVEAIDHALGYLRPPRA